MICDEGAIVEHRTDSRFIPVLHNVGGGSWVIHKKIIEGHVLLKHYIEHILVKTKVFRWKLVDMVFSEDGRGKFQ